MKYYENKKITITGSKVLLVCGIISFVAGAMLLIYDMVVNTVSDDITYWVIIIGCIGTVLSGLSCATGK